MKEYQYETLSQEESMINIRLTDEQKAEMEEYPETIEDLKKWLQAQGISEISDFGLYINYNSNKTGHAGLYKADDEYILYQNGYDGHKDIIYKGPNEKFAVKQFCILFRKTDEIHKKIYKIYEKKVELTKFEKTLKKVKEFFFTNLIGIGIFAFAILLTAIVTAIALYYI